eukprot:2327043-Prymnesium_polylepis.1
MLLPMFGTQNAGYAPLSWSPRVGAYQAVREINNKTDGVEDALLPGTRLFLSYRDSKCDRSVGLQGALSLTQQAFEGKGVEAIIGCGCSGASLQASLVGGGAEVPVISPSSTSPALSEDNPYFVRTVASDAVTAIVVRDILVELWEYTRVALAFSTDPYGSGIGITFSDSAPAAGLAIATTQRLEPSATADFSSQQMALDTSRARILVLFCQQFVAGHFLTVRGATLERDARTNLIVDGIPPLQTAYEQGVGGPGFLIIGEYGLDLDGGLWKNEPMLSANSTLRRLVLNGLFS